MGEIGHYRKECPGGHQLLTRVASLQLKQCIIPIYQCVHSHASEGIPPHVPRLLNKLLCLHSSKMKYSKLLSK